MAGPRVFTVEEASAFVPKLEAIFGEVEKLREKIRTAKLRLNALEMIWGETVHEEKCPDHGELLHYVEELKRLEEGFQAKGVEIAELGGMVKGLDPGLVDFYGVRDGRLVCLCWQRGEKRIAHWHHVDAGFSGREPL